MSKSKKLIIFCGIVAAAVIFLFNFFSRQYVVPIIMYHSVNPDADPQNRLALTVKTFERQMRFLKTHRYNVLALEELADLIRQKKKIPPKTLAITFDDGYKDNYTYAFPILKKYHLPATLFIIVREVGRLQNDRLSWNQIQEMQDSGIFSIGSHGIGPDPLFKMPSEVQLWREIFDSRKILEERLGRAVTLFSYPEGMFDAKIRQLVIEAGYRAAVATNPGRDYPDDDVFALKRLRISENAGNLFVFAVETSGYYTFMKESKRRKHGKK